MAFLKFRNRRKQKRTSNIGGNLKKALGLVLIGFIFVLLIGVIGFKYFFELNNLDALHTTALYMSGLGPMYEINTNSQKSFSAFYALFASYLGLAIVVYFVDEVVDLIFFPDTQQ